MIKWVSGWALVAVTMGLYCLGVIGISCSGNWPGYQLLLIVFGISTVFSGCAGLALAWGLMEGRWYWRYPLFLVAAAFQVGWMYGTFHWGLSMPRTGPPRIRDMWVLSTALPFFTGCLALAPAIMRIYGGHRWSRLSDVPLGNPRRLIELVPFSAMMAITFSLPIGVVVFAWGFARSEETPLLTIAGVCLVPVGGFLAWPVSYLFMRVRGSYALAFSLLGILGSGILIALVDKQLGSIWRGSPVELAVAATAGPAGLFCLLGGLRLMGYRWVSPVRKPVPQAVEVAIDEPHPLDAG